MRVLISRGKPVPIKVPRTVESQHSKMDSNNANECTISSYVDPDICDSKNVSLDSRLFHVPNTVRQPDMDFSRLTGDYFRGNSKQSTWSCGEMGFGVQENVSGANIELQLLNNQAEQQRLLTSVLQKQLQNFNLIQQQQYRQKLLTREKQKQIAQESTVTEANSMRMPKNAKIEIVPTNNSPPLCVSNQPKSLDRFESMQAHSRQQRNEKPAITLLNDKVAEHAEHTSKSRQLSQHPEQTNKVKSNGSLRKKKQVRANIRSKKRDVSTERDPTVRGKSTTYSCAECNRAFIRSSHLIEHLRIHGGEKPFKCGECGSCFSLNRNLTVHKRIHTGAKPFECQICNVAFNRKFNLSCHLSRHTNEKPFICDICKQSFRRKFILSDHMNIHSGNRPYKCNVCQKSFQKSQALSRHRKVHAEEDE